MTNAILPRRLISLGLTMLLGCILLGLMTMLPVAAQDENLTGINMPIYEFAQLNYSIPSEVLVEPDDLKLLNYSGGREIQASLFLNGSRVTIHLLYPCQAPQTQLETSELIALLEAYNPAIKQVNYSDTMAFIDGLPAIFGNVGTQIFTAYQPTNQTVAAIVLDISTNEEIMVRFLENLQITVNEGISPLMPGYCPDTSATQSEVKSAENVTVDVKPAEVSAENEEASSQTEETILTKSSQTAFSAKDKMASDALAAKKKLEEIKKGMKR